MMSKIMCRTMTVAAALVPGIGAAQAQQPRTEKTISLAIAGELAAVAECQAKGYAVTATVVDRAGQVKAVHRADGTDPHTIDASRRKTYPPAPMRTGRTRQDQGSPEVIFAPGNPSLRRGVSAMANLLEQAGTN